MELYVRGEGRIHPISNRTVLPSTPSCARWKLQWELSSHVLSVLETEIFPGTRHVRHITNISPRSQLRGPYASERITQELGHNRTSILDATLERRRPPFSLFPSNMVGENIQRLFHLTLSLSLSDSRPLVFFVTS